MRNRSSLLEEVWIEVAAWPPPGAIFHETRFFCDPWPPLPRPRCLVMTDGRRIHSRAAPHPPPIHPITPGDEISRSERPLVSLTPTKIYRAYVFCLYVFLTLAVISDVLMVFLRPGSVAICFPQYQPIPSHGDPTHAPRIGARGFGIRVRSCGTDRCTMLWD